MLFWSTVMLLTLSAYDSYRRGGWALAACIRIVEAIGGISLAKTLFLVGLLALTLGLSLLFGGDGAYLSAFLAPELLIWFTVFDIAALVDVTILVVAIGARGFVAQVRQTIGVALPRLALGLRGRRPRAPKSRPRKPAPPSGDPERPCGVFSGVPALVPV